MCVCFVNISAQYFVHVCVCADMDVCKHNYIYVSVFLFYLQAAHYLGFFTLPVRPQCQGQFQDFINFLYFQIHFYFI